jgi:hypothetical protein
MMGLRGLGLVLEDGVVDRKIVLSGIAHPGATIAGFKAFLSAVLGKNVE